MRKLIIFFSFLSVSLSLFSQPQMKFDRESVDFGTILLDNPVTAEFKVTNTGDSYLVLTDVKASCACTAIEWPEKGISPGESASIKAVFDAKALGTLYKEVEIHSNTSTEPKYLQMSGRVVANADEVTNTEGFDIVMGDVRLNKDTIFFDQVYKGTNPVDEILVLNTTRASFEPILMHVPNYLEVSCYPERIPAGRTGRIRIKLLTENLQEMGLTQTSVYFNRMFGDNVSPENEIPVSVVLLPDFSNLSTVSRGRIAKMKLSTTNLQIYYNGKPKAKGEVMITNTGQQELKIDRLQVLSDAVSVSLPKKKVGVGQTIKMKVEVTKDRVKKNRGLGILMITNDPESAGQIVKIKAN
jgi:hypothetical protein